MNAAAAGNPVLDTGVVRVDRINELTMPMFGPDEFFRHHDPASLDVADLGPDEFDSETAKIVLSSCSYLVRSPGLTMLVDTGIGDDRDRRSIFRQLKTGWFERLTALIDPGDIDVVVSTHLHMDHVGWNTRLVDGQWVPTFPRARYLFNRAEIETLSSENVTNSVQRNGDFVADSIDPIFAAGLAEVVDVPLDLSPHVQLESAPGDTVGHIIVRLHDAQRTLALITGDVFHHPLQVADPTLTSNFSALPEVSIDTRLRYFAESADDAVPMLAGHVAAYPSVYTERVGDHDFRIHQRTMIGRAEHELRLAEEARILALNDGDSVALAGMCHPSLAYLHSTGLLDDRDAYVGKLADGTYRYDGLRFTPERVTASETVGVTIGETMGEVHTPSTTRVLRNKTVNAWRRTPHQGWQWVSSSNVAIAAR